VPDDPYASPSLYPLALDVAGDRVGLVALSEAAYEAASFLDERLLPAAGPLRWVGWPELERGVAADAARRESDFIFHLGHVGSTLLSRLLGMSARIFSVREPAILRTLARMSFEAGGADRPWDRATFEARLDRLLSLWARVWRPGQKTLLKATSFVSEIAPLLMRRSPAARAILLFASPAAYMETLFAGDASRGELKAMAAMRLDRLNHRLGGPVWRLDRLSEGETAAMSWTCEILGLAATAAEFEGRALWMDFEDFLDHPAAGLAAALTCLHGSADRAEIAAMLAGPHLARYSKAPEHPYDAGLRRRLRAEARREHGEEIERGIAWLNAAGSAHPAIAAAARQAAGARRLEQDRL
jgi:hypothetical protein